MQDIKSTFFSAFHLLFTKDPDLLEIVQLSLQVSLSAVFFALIIGAPIGAALGILQFPGRIMLRVIMSALMGLPPVVAGLMVYLLFSASGPLGVLELLYTPTAMIIAQFLLVLPIITTLTERSCRDLYIEYDETLQAMGASKCQRLGVILYDARFALTTAALVGIGRALAEVGAVMIVGGNIHHHTRVMTTAIALETSRGQLALALGLGMLLLIISLILNIALTALTQGAEKHGNT